MATLERDWPEGHPLSSDYDPNSEAAKAYRPIPTVSRDWPTGHPAASDTLADRVNGGYKATPVRTEDALKPGGLCLRSRDVLVVACPQHGDRHLLSLTAYHYDPEAVTVDGEILLSCGLRAHIERGVWHVA